MKWNTPFVVGVVWIGVMFGNAVAYVGRVDPDCAKPIPWWFPALVLSLMISLFGLGYLGGKEH